MADENIKLFLKKVTQEILYNVTFSHEKNTGSGSNLNIYALSRQFKERVGNKPMNFFGLINNTDNEGWFEFVRESPGLFLDGYIVSIDDEEDIAAYKHYNSHSLPFYDNNVIWSSSFAKYREMLLIAACNLVYENDGSVDVNAYTDKNGNTPLHFIAALPGTHLDDFNLFKYLLDAGADPTIENSDGINILHVLAGRIKAEKDEDGDVIFGEGRIDAVCWEYGYRQAILNYLSQKLSCTRLFYLANRAGRDGNTVMHEWAMSTLDIDFVKQQSEAELEPNLVMKENKLALKLIKFGGNLKTMNNMGLLPIHFCVHPEVLEFLVREGAVCRVRNYQGDTPLLFILKYFVALPMALLAFPKYQYGYENVVRDVFDFVVNDGVLKRSRCDPIFVVEQLRKVIEKQEIKEMAWITDNQGVSPLEVVLICIRLVCCRQRANLPLGIFLRILSQFVTIPTNQNSLKHHNNKRKSPLHVLLNVEGVYADVDRIHSTDTSFIIQSLELLLQHGIEVNAVDAKGQTALHICCLHYKRNRILFGQCAQILMNQNALIDLEDNSGNSVQDILANNDELKSICIQTKRKVHCHSRRHQSQVIQLAASTNVKVVNKKYRYFSELPIGTGAFSCVYVAIKDENEDKISKLTNCSTSALKRLEKARVDPKEIKREMDLLLSISRNCENIVDYYETVDVKSFYYIALELMEGDLELFVKDSDMVEAMVQDPAIKVNATRDIVKGLAFLHENKFLHRDLKPGNILYAVYPTLCFKIGDFGLAKNISSSHTLTSTRGTGAMAPGTRCWMAPELVSLQSRDHTMESDVFVLGLVIHYLLTLGKHAFASGTEEQATHVIERRVVDMNLAIDESLSNEAKHFIQLILAKKPERRPPANSLPQHPFLWSDKKKIKFLMAVGDQVEAANPRKHPNSALENCLQLTDIGIEIGKHSWDLQIPDLYHEMTTAWKHKKYRTYTLIDLVRFIRNAYHHKEEHSPGFKVKLENNIFLKEFPTLFFDVYLVLSNKGFLQDSSRTNIRDVIDEI